MFVEALGCGVAGDTEHVAAADPGEAAGSGNEQETQRAHATQSEGEGALAAAAPRRSQGRQLEAPAHVVGQDAELLPRAVSPIVVGGHHVEGKLALEFGQGLLLSPAARHEVPQLPSDRGPS